MKKKNFVGGLLFALSFSLVGQTYEKEIIDYYI